MLLALVFVAPRARAQTPVRVLVAPPRSVGRVDDDTRTVIAELIAQALAEEADIQVLAASEVSNIARSSSEHGCNDDDCVLEIAGAMGVDHVVVSLLVQKKHSYRLQLGWLEVVNLRLRGTQVIETQRLDQLDAELGPALLRLRAGERDASLEPMEPSQDQAPGLLTEPPAGTEPRGPSVTASESAAPSWLKLGAINALGLGVGGLAFTVFMALSLRQTLLDANSPTEDKDLTLAVGPWLLLGGTLGSGLLFGGGACLWGMHLLVDEP